MLYSWKFYCRKSAVVIQTFPVIAIDDNECESDPSICGRDATCFNTDGSYYCQCHEGFTTHSTHNFTQEDRIECEGKESLIWWISYDLCAAEKTSESVHLFSDINECVDGSADCGPNTECVNSEGGYKCTCEDGYITRDGKEMFNAGQGVQCIGKKLFSPKNSDISHLLILKLFQICMSLFLLFSVKYDILKNVGNSWR